MTRLIDIGSDLVARRRALGFSQRELGELVGVAQQQIARWEAGGYRGASLERVDAIASALTFDIASGHDDLPMAAEAGAAYGTATVAPVRDLGEITARLRAHTTELRDEFGISRIGVFGSFVTGEQTAASDVDLLVEEHRLRGLEFVGAANRVEDWMGRPVDFVQPHLLRERLRDRVLKEAVYVWSA